MIDQGAIVSEPAFDQARADAALHALGSAIIGDANYRDRDWDAIVLVFELDGRTSDFGYVFGPGDAWEAEGPDSWDVLNLAKDFREATRVPGKDHWKKCLVRIEREGGKMGVEFDYSGDRWQPNMADPEGFARSLRQGEG
jgi:hypothetical protein